MESMDLDWSWVRCGLGGGVLLKLTCFSTASNPSARLGPDGQALLGQN